MSRNHKTTLLLGLLLIIVCSSLRASSTRLALVSAIASIPVAVPTPPDPVAQMIEARDRAENGITVGEPRVYDDAQLQQRLEELEARLATLQLIDQKTLADRVGAVNGASLQQSSIGFNVQTPSVPGVTTTTKLPTQTTTETTAAGATQSGLQVVSGSATQDVQTTRTAFGPPTATAPAPTITMPSTFSVSSSDTLNEMMQLTAEINGLRLMLSGDLSSHYIRGGPKLGNKMTKLNTTLGFEISVRPDARYKDAIAVVEVEVENPCTTLSDEAPAVTALLPKEKTYNVAAITDKSTSIGGGVATQLLGVSGSWLTGHKTYYLVQDQDTVALSFTPGDQPAGLCPTAGGGMQPKKRVGFLWQFRPVMGRRFVRIADKTTFVRLAFPVPEDAGDGDIGTVTVRSYWRKYDRNTGVQKEVIAGSVRQHFVHANPFDIPRYRVAVGPTAFNYRDSLENLGGGQALVSLHGRYLPGTTVRIGPVILAEGDRLKHNYSGIQFTASLSDLATKKVVLVGHDGTEVPLELAAPIITSAPVHVHSCGLTEQFSAGIGVVRYNTKLDIVGNPRITTIDESSSQLALDFNIKQEALVVATGMKTLSTITPTPADDIPTLAITIGDRVFSTWDGSLKRVGGNTLTAVVPAALLSSTPEIVLQTILPERQCRTHISLAAFSIPSQPERLLPINQASDKTKFLLYGSRLANIIVLEPTGVVPQSVGNPADNNHLISIELTADQLKTHKQVLVQRPGERPFLISIPALDAPTKPNPPKATERLTVGADEVTIEGDGLSDISKVSFHKTVLDPANVEVAAGGKSLRLTGLRRLGVTSRAATQTVVLQFNSGSTASVSLDIVDSKVEVKNAP